MNWRPKKGWSNPHLKDILEVKALLEKYAFPRDIELSLHNSALEATLLPLLRKELHKEYDDAFTKTEVFEAGADAMLEALRPLLSTIQEELCLWAMKEPVSLPSLDDSIDKLAAILGWKAADVKGKTSKGDGQ